MQLDERPALADTTAPISYTTRPLRVLVVEDGIDAVRALSALLSDMGHRVEWAINGYAALEVARKFLPHVVLLDLGLPGMDGYEVCSRLKGDARLQSSRIIAITAYSQEHHRIRARTAGCELHLAKPVSPQALFDILESVGVG